MLMRLCQAFRKGEKREAMKKVLKGFNVFGDVLSVIAIIALIVMIVVTVADVFLRELFKAPITGAVEITRMMMVCMSPAFVSALFLNRHVNVGLFIDKLGRKGQLAFDTFGYLFTMVLSGLMCYQGFVEMMKQFTRHQVYTILKIPTWPFYAVFAVSMGCFAISIIVKLVSHFADKSVYAAQPAAEGEEADA